MSRRACGASLGPSGLIPHLVSGKNCKRAHTRDEAKALHANAESDPAPWLEAVKRTEAQRDEIVRWSKDRKLPKELREHYRACAKLLETVVLAGLIRIGPQKYEIPRQGEEFVMPKAPADDA